MSDESVTKRMGQLLRKGAALLNKACPKCNTPLLGLPDGTMYCAKCNKTVVEKTTSKQKVEETTTTNDVLTQLANKILASLDVLCQKLPERPHPEEIRTFIKTTKDLVETLQIIRNLQG